ncbi:hypothetical protein [Halosimplex pelagicum]|uniref:Uncharacterized protein n=1 Tax=Halosimplex pelagicum TaxID=869886 RepID=A0A7D5T5C0_9EURY|nr:hypothetical protein [Halosimplex pelagicum]QLH82248.1 hypothetical protein HZS54_11785 [Halosimplex pelagicum]
MVDNTDNLRDALRAATTEICATWDIEIHDTDDIEITQVSDDEYEALVPISGRVLLEDLLDDQGTLLGIKNDIAAELEGFQDDRLLLTLDLG